jgi:glycosyltransferase involved in cell wall biosynthesis
MDVDDAIFLGARGASAGVIAKRAQVIICGNQFLADYFSAFGAVSILPTAVDTDEFRPGQALQEEQQQEKQVIGWSGSSSGFEYLRLIEPALANVLRKFRHARFRVVADKPPKFLTLDPARVEFERWTPERQVRSLQEFTVGIMPLSDSPWARGKCSFKMLTYMAVGVPVLVSPVGMNVEVLAHGQSGLSARSIDDWVDSLTVMLSDSQLRRRMGVVGRGVVERHYSKRVLAPRFVDVLRRLL